MGLKAVKVDMPEGCNIILGQTHFIKTAEDKTERREFLRKIGYKL